MKPSAIVIFAILTSSVGFAKGTLPDKLPVESIEVAGLSSHDKLINAAVRGCTLRVFNQRDYEICINGFGQSIFKFPYRPFKSSQSRNTESVATVESIDAYTKSLEVESSAAPENLALNMARDVSAKHGSGAN
jgi:hypothetical protein